MRSSFLAAAVVLAAISIRAEPLLPTGEGTTWEYDSTETLTGGAPARTVVTVRAGRQVFDGKEVVKLETLAGNVVTKTELVAVDEKSITCVARSGKDGKVTKLNPPEPIIAGPLKVGAAWKVENEVAGIITHQSCTAIAEENVTVPAGRFRAFHVQCEGSSLMSIKFDRWFVPGTGIVKETTVLRGPGMMQRVTLDLSKVSEVLAKPVASPSAAAPRPTEQPPSPTPVAAVTPMATASAPTATPEEQTTPPPKKLTVEVSSDPAGGLKTEFKSDVANIYVRWQGHDLPADATVRVTWVAEDVGDLVEPNFVIDETESVAPAPDASARFTLGRPPDGWAEGKYRVEFYVNDLPVETVKVTIVK